MRIAEVLLYRLSNFLGSFLSTVFTKLRRYYYRSSPPLPYNQQIQHPGDHHRQRPEYPTRTGLTFPSYLLSSNLSYTDWPVLDDPIPLPRMLERLLQISASRRLANVFCSSMNLPTQT